MLAQPGPRTGAIFLVPTRLSRLNQHVFLRILLEDLRSPLLSAISLLLRQVALRAADAVSKDPGSV